MAWRACSTSSSACSGSGSCCCRRARPTRAGPCTVRGALRQAGRRLGARRADHRRGGRLGGPLAIDHEDLADVLYRLRAEALTDLVEPHLALFALALRTDLDQLVTAQTNVDLLHHGLR